MRVSRCLKASNNIPHIQKFSRIPAQQHRREAAARDAEIIQFRGYTITPDQWVVLNAVAEHEGICQRDLAGKTLKDRPTVTRILIF